MTVEIEKTTANAYLRDGALILYFDMAETPFLSRFDLDSLAQANFEVADKKDGIYSLVLRDYTGQVQTIGQFSSKGDAHNALYAILKALLSHKEKSQKTCSKLGCFLKGVLKFFLAILLLLALLWGYVWLRLPAKTVHSNPSIAQSDAIRNAQPVVPQGEAVDADEFLKQAAPPVAAPAVPVPPVPAEIPKE
jgi:hypothetical protein